MTSPQRSRAKAPRVVTALLVLSLCMTACQAARSCTNQGQVHVPCEDALALEPPEKFLITLAGHSCYEIRLSSQAPLDVFFYEAEGSFYAWRLREMQAIQPDLGLLDSAPVSTSGDDAPSDTNSSALLPPPKSSNSSSVSDHLCDRSLNCHRIMHGLARRGVYNLVLAYSRGGNAATKKKDSEGIFLSLESCDQVSLSHIIGLLLVACMGFVSVMLCLCLLGEYALGLRSLTKFRRTLQRHHQFIELAQVEPKKDLDYNDDSSSSNSDSPKSPMLPPGPPATPKATAATPPPAVIVVVAPAHSPASST